MKYILLLISSVTLLTSCASIVHGTRQKVSVTTNPPGATVSDGEITLTTPAVFELKRNRDYVLSISKNGYESQSVKIVRVISGVAVGNIVAGGPIGLGVDAVSGALWRLEPEALSVTLRPVGKDEVVRDEQRLTTATLANTMQELEVLKQQNLLTEEEHKAVQATLQSATEIA